MEGVEDSFRVSLTGFITVKKYDSIIEGQIVFLFRGQICVCE